MMKALRYEAPGVLTVRDIDRPEPQPGWTLLRTRAVGICGSDVHGYLGLTGRRIPPLVMGHEVVGEIIGEGHGTPLDAQSGLGTGPLVAVNPLIACGQCDTCQRGARNLCRNRLGLGMLRTAGAMSEYFVAPATNLVPLGGADPVMGALAEPLAVGIHAVGMMARHRRPDVRTARTAVVGAGMIGLAILLALHDIGVGSSVICDVRDDRLERIKRMIPAAETVNTREKTWNQVREQHAAEGFDAVFEAVGRSESAGGSAELAGLSSVVVWVGNMEPIVAVPMQHVVTGEVMIAGAYGFTDEEFRQSVQRLIQRPSLRTIVDKVVALDQAPEAFDELARGASPALKIVIDPTLRSRP
jgi:threonine dehydrogenase-like Zn-dependent dehydrogenase